MRIKLKPIDQQVIVITGASSGIGLATAQTASKKGAKVVLAARSKHTLDVLVEELRRDGGDAIAVACDVANRKDVEDVAAQAAAAYGRINTWVNNAGLGMYGPLDRTDDADARRLFDVNFWGLVNGSLVALPYLKKQGGALINIGSEVSEASTPMLGFYVASKHAVKGFTDCLRIEVQRIDESPVAVTLIEPTAVDTPFAQHARNYMTTEAKLPDPKVSPQAVADAILAAAVRNTRTKRVGAMASVNTGVSKMAPSLADRLSAMRVDELHEKEPAHEPHGALNQASEETHMAGHTSGRTELE
jgi:short-subunit dehydrogenase